MIEKLRIDYMNGEFHSQVGIELSALQIARGEHLRIDKGDAK